MQQPPSQSPAGGQNLVSPIGYRNSSCGYCRGNSGSLTFCAVTSSLNPAFYERLLNRGWRRSGTLLYKPDQRASCCPHYTIGLRASLKPSEDASSDEAAFKPSKDQRQALNRFNRYVLGTEYIRDRARTHPRRRDEARRYKQTFDLVERVHESEAARTTATARAPSRENPSSSSVQHGQKDGKRSRRVQKQKEALNPAHKFSVTLEPDTFTEEKYRLFEEYQRLVHHEPPDKISRRGFRGFLCDSPLVRTATRQLGSYHQMYRLDGTLVALAVLDLLPNAVSAVYFIYHSSISAWHPGKLSALREIALAAEMGREWYMMGFYIESCKKMQYKANFKPQFVLDPESYEWLLLEGVNERLRMGKYVSLSGELVGDDGVAAVSGSGGGDLDGTDGTDDTIPPEEDEEDDKGRHENEKENEESPSEGEDEEEEEEDDNDDDNDEQKQQEGDDQTMDRLSLFERNMPGILPRSALTPQLMDNIRVLIWGQEVLASHLNFLESSYQMDLGIVGGFECEIGELVAALGVEAALEVVVVY